MVNIEIAPPSTHHKIVEAGIEKGIIWCVCKAPLWGAMNGYVELPEGHPYLGLDIEKIDVEVHGGLTYAKNSWIGFDTLHYGDYWESKSFNPMKSHSEITWTQEKIVEETKNLARQISKINLKDF